jgi:hypothetical protein
MKRSTQVSLLCITVVGLGAGAPAVAQDSGGGQSIPHAPGFHSSPGRTPSTADTTSYGGFGQTGYRISGGG